MSTQDLCGDDVDRVVAILETYLKELEKGPPADPDRLLDAHPELAARLRPYLFTLHDIHSAAARLREPLLPDASPSDAESAPEFGRLGDYEIVREVGRGGMGIVYEARQISLNRKVALKVLPFVAVLDRKTLQRFQTEAQCAARLHDTHIVPVYAKSVSSSLAATLIGADCVVDCTPTDLTRGQSSLERSLAVLDSGATLALAAKTALLADPLAFLRPDRWQRVGFGAVLGGTGLFLKRELHELRTSCRSIACVPNATTTCVIQTIERGGSIDEGLERTRAAGLLEADPTQDLDGTDAALKLVIVASLLSGSGRSLEEVVRAGDLSARHDHAKLEQPFPDPALLRRRYAEGRTTRLVGRLLPGGRLELAFEQLQRGSTLAVPKNRVVYCYELGPLGRRVHLGSGLGPIGTARALLEDVDVLLAESLGRDLEERRAR